MKCLAHGWMSAFSRSHPARGAWIEMQAENAALRERLESHPARGAWIEINIFEAMQALLRVAPRKGCVD